MHFRSHFSLKIRSKEAGEMKGKREEKGIMVVFGVCGMIVQSIKVYINVCNLTTSVQSPTHFLWLILKMKGTWMYV